MKKTAPMAARPRRRYPKLSSIFAWAVIGTAGLAPGVACSSYSTHVEAPESSALGRVVIYRNGIAYYERVAWVEAGKVTLTVPNDKVDDFLKSLTIEEANTRRPLPLAYKTAGANEDGKVDMTIRVDDPAVERVILTYITESPAWKPSYRVVVDEDDKVNLQGWAVVDNTSGETWRRVRVGVGSSSALSFRFDLRSVKNVWRETLEADERFAVAPPTGGSTRTESGETQTVLAAIDGDALPAQDFGDDLVTVQLDAPEAAARPEDSTTKRPSAYQQEQTRRLAEGRKQVRDLVGKVATNDGEIVLEAYDPGNRRNDVGNNIDRAHWLRNELIREGIAPARIKVEEREAKEGQAGGVRVVQAQLPKSQAPDEGEPVGESHFQSQTPMTVEKGTSAMIAVLDDGAEGEVVYLYDSESERGNARFAFKAVRFVNPTQYTLESGPMTVYGEGRFIGEGLTEPIPPHAIAVIPFALDRQIIVEREGDERDRISKLMTLQRGVLRTEVQHERITRLKVTSILREDTKVFLRHSVRKGWTLVKSPEVHERIGDAHLFELDLAAGATKTIEIVEATPLQRTLDLRSPDAIDLVRVYLDSADHDGRFAEQMKKLLAIHSEMANYRQEIELERIKMDEYRVRMVELEDQILSLKNVPNSRQLLANLQTKLRDMSNRVQEGTISVVNLEQKLLMARIRFQDGIAELSLDAETQTAEPNTH